LEEDGPAFSHQVWTVRIVQNENMCKEKKKYEYAAGGLEEVRGWGKTIQQTASGESRSYNSKKR